MDDKKSSQLPLIGLIGILALFGVTAGRRAGGPTDPGADSAASAPAQANVHPEAAPVQVTDARTHHPFLLPLAEFTERKLDDFLYDDEHGYRVRPAKPAGDPPVDEPQPLLTFLAPYYPLVLVAALPDPDEVRDAYRFDVWVEAIQRAAAAPTDIPSQSYTLDRYWFPWSAGKDGKSTAAGTNHRLPGLLLFRTSPVTFEDNSVGVRLLLVLLVGETPTKGVQKEALVSALDFAASLAKPQGDTLAIAGPTFSGSQTSLQVALNEWRSRARGGPGAFPGDLPVEIVASATSLDRERFEKSVPSATLHGTSVPDNVVFEELLGYVRRLHRGQPGPVRIARLRESNTGYGLSRMWTQQAGPAKGQPARAAGAPDLPRYEITEVPFPIHISEIHAAHEKADREKTSRLPQLPVFDQKLRIPVDPESSHSDLPAPRGGPMTTVVDEMMLSELMVPLAAENFPYVAIVATDYRDKIFLASLVRKHLPDAQILMTIGSQLLAHPDYRKHLLGTYVASSYPLMSSGLVWDILDWDQKRLLVFPEQSAQAYFNAVAAQLGKESVMIDYRPPQWFRDNPARAMRAGNRSISGGVPDLTRPGTWISRVGDGGLYPLAFVPLAQNNTYVYRLQETPAVQDAADRAQEAPAVPWIWRTILFGLGFAYVVLFINLRRAWKDDRREPGALSRSAADARPGTLDLRLLFSERYLRPGLPPQIMELLLLMVFAGLACYVVRLKVQEAQMGGRWWSLSFNTTMFWFVAKALAVWACVTWACRLALRYVSLRSPVSLGGGRGIVAGHTTLAPPSPTLPPRGGKGEEARAIGSDLKGVGPAGSRWQPIGPARAARLSAFVGGAMAGGWLSWELGRFLLRFGSSEFTQAGSNRMALLRTVELGSGISAFTPVLCIAGVLAWWSYSELKRILLIRKYPLACPLHAEGPDGRIEVPALRSAVLAIRKRHHRLYRLLFGNWLVPAVPRGMAILRNVNPLTWPAMLILSAVFATVASHWLPTPEGRLFDLVVQLGLAAGTCAVMWTIVRFVQLWKRLEGLHYEISRLPMQRAFEDLPDYLVRHFGSYLFLGRPRDWPSKAVLRQVAWLVENRPTTRAAGISPLRASIARWCQPPESMSLGEVSADLALAGARERRAETLAEFARHVSVLVAHERWKGRAALAAFGEPAQKDTGEPAASDKRYDEWLTAAESFLAMMLVVYLSQFRLQLKNQALFLIAGPILLLWAITSYPFQPQEFLFNAAVGLMLLSALALFYVVTGINRDELLSRITHTKPRSFAIDWHSFSTFGAYLLPLILVLLAQVPGVGDALSGWFTAILDSLPSR